MRNWVNCGKAKAMRAMLIRSQADEAATPVARASEGSETRATAEAMTAPRAPSTRLATAKGGDIVRHPGESPGTGLNSPYNSWYGVPVLYTPGKNVLLRNVGRQTDYVGAP